MTNQQFARWLSSTPRWKLVAGVVAVVAVIAVIGVSLSGADDPGPTGSAGGTSKTDSTVDGGEVELTASDRGVTEEAVTIGVTLPNDALSGRGFDTGIRSDLDRYASALGEFVNSQGGVGGREVVVEVRPTDPTSTTDQDAACQSMLNDREVFGVVDLAITNGPAQACIAQQGQTPYVHPYPWSEEFQAASDGYDVSYLPTIDRISRTLARDLSESGWLEEDSVVGVFGDNCPTTEPTVTDVLVPALEDLVDHVEVGLHDCTIDGVLTQPPTIATRFRTAEVDRVISVSNYVSMQILLQAADGLGNWAPEYAVTDWFAGVSDTLNAGYNATQFDGAIGLTSTHAPLLNADREPYDGIDRCNEAATAAGLPALDDAESAAHVALCDLFFLMVDGISAAGPNPTRPAWAEAIQSLGSRTAAGFGDASFGPGKTNGADEAYTAVWHAECTCWQAEDGLRPIAD